MKILMFAINDPAGTAIAFTNAINRYSDHACRLVTKEIRYNFLFEKDLHLPWLNPQEYDEIEELLRTSDIFHFHMTADEHLELGPFKPKAYLKGKSILHHHHGHPDFRATPWKYEDKYRKLNRKAIVSTPDLLRFLPESKWQPNLVPIYASDYLPTEGTGNGTVRISQSPTRTDLKNTSEFEIVVEKLQRFYPYVEKVLIENMKHSKCLTLKQSCDIHFDHMQGYFGVSSLEGLSQGKPVIAGIDDWNIDKIKTFTGCNQVPWIIARDRRELEMKMTELVKDKEKRHLYGAEGRRFMEKYWNEPRIVENLLNIYMGL